MQAPPARIIDLFCGCGGFSLGAHAAGLGPIAAFDIDPILTSSFAQNFPKTALIKADISLLNGASIKRRVGGAVDGVFGGPPCQGFSDMGHRRVDDPRRDLLYHFFRLVAELKPAFFVMENVRGLNYPDARVVLDEGLNLVGKYKLLGPIILDAGDFGAATRRPRLFVIGYDPGRCDPIVEADIEAASDRPATVREAMYDLSSAKHLGDSHGFDLWKIKSKNAATSYAASLRSPDATFTSHLPTKHSRAVIRRFAKVKQGGVDAVGRHPRLAWNGQCPTLRAGTGSDRGSFQSVRPIHPNENRVITVREAARLQGFPDAFKFHPTIWHSFRMIGNSVSPIISRAIFSLIAHRMNFQIYSQAAAE